MLGTPAWSGAERTERFVEFVDLLDRLLRHPETNFSGRYWSANEARSYPGCVQQPRIPFAVAAAGRRSMRVAAKHASVWVTTGDRSHSGPAMGPAEGAMVVAQQMALLDEICEEEGRDPATLQRLVLTGTRLDAGLRTAESFDEVKQAYAAVGATDLVVHWPRSSEPYMGYESVLGQIAG